MMMQRRDKRINQALGATLNKKVKSSNVLLVGAGGIGCEILKNIVCCGFGRITIIDLDTIDLSNLNRQFLFRKHHIKKPKALVAKETASKYNPAVKIDAQHASIFDKQYNVDFFASFDLVFNALDNLAARRHVNRMCMAADVPLIESGTTGYNGQVQPIRRGQTECYDCNPKPVQKSYPICTIRSTPSQPIHCIVWAKSYLLPELFGASEEQADMTVTAEDSAEEVTKLKEEAQALQRLRKMMGSDDFAKSVFDKVFCDDIERLRSMSEMWKSQKPPDPLRFDEVERVDDGDSISKQEQQVWSVEENTAVLCHALSRLSLRTQTGESVEFDKDDKDTLDFVAAAANLRAHVFSIAPKSEWDIKQMAGNIIPAIATSNAMTASLSVFSAFKILKGQDANAKPALPLGGAKMTFLTSRSAERTIISDALQPPKPDCPICSPVYARLRHSTTTRLQEIVEVLKQRFDYTELTIASNAGIIYDQDEEDNLEKTLQELGVTGFLTITDDGDAPKSNLVLSLTQVGEDGDVEIVPADLEIPPKPVETVAEPELEAASGAKRKREADEELENGTKKMKRDDTAIVIGDDGTLLVDD